jgi:hypothetical protein
MGMSWGRGSRAIGRGRGMGPPIPPGLTASRVSGRGRTQSQPQTQTQPQSQPQTRSRTNAWVSTENTHNLCVVYLFVNKLMCLNSPKVLSTP